MKEYERNFFLVAVRDEARSLVGAVRVDDAANLHFALAGLDHLALVRHDSDRPTVDAGVGRDDGFAVVGLVLDHRVGVDQALEQRAHALRVPVLRGNVEGRGTVFVLEVGVDAAREQGAQLVAIGSSRSLGGESAGAHLAAGRSQGPGARTSGGRPGRRAGPQGGDGAAGAIAKSTVTTFELVLFTSASTWLNGEAASKI